MGAEPSAWRLGQCARSPADERRAAAAFIHRHATSDDDEQQLLNVLGLTTDTGREDDRAH